VTGALSFPDETGGIPDRPILNASADEGEPGGFSFERTPQLTGALRAGDEAAFGWLHRQWNDRLYRYCFVLMRGDAATAAEVAQATYLRLYRHVRKLPHEQALWNWLARAAQSAATDHRRVNGRYQSALRRFADWLALGDAQVTFASDHGKCDDAMIQVLEQALGELSGEERELIEMRYRSEHRLDAIAGHSGHSVRAVEGRLARLRTRLRRTILKLIKEGSS
jgi:RNA polymerase sigma-70 factor (ECF subfamily)